MKAMVIGASAALAFFAHASVVTAQNPERQHREGPAPGAGVHTPPPSIGNREMNYPLPRVNPPLQQLPRLPRPAPLPERAFRNQQRAIEQDRVRELLERNAERARSRERETQEQKRFGARERTSPATKEMQGARAGLGADERLRMHAACDLRRARVAHPWFDWHVGHRVPRRVRLFPAPIEVSSWFPDYRDYGYFVAGNDICIVNPRTYEVVDVIDEAYFIAVPPKAPRLALSAAQIALVRKSMPPDYPLMSVPLRLALGAEIPEDVPLHRFAAIVLDGIPELRDFRFLITAEQILIVDPSDRSISLVIDRL
jgi:hypothetical protein